MTDPRNRETWYAVPLSRAAADEPFDVVMLPELPMSGDVVRQVDGTSWIVIRRCFNHEDGCVVAIVDRGLRTMDGGSHDRPT